MSFIVEIPIEVITIDEDGYHLFLQGHINEVPVRFLLDTGASKTVIGLHFAAANLDANSFEDNPKRATGISTNDLSSKTAILESIFIGQYKTAQLKCSILPLEHVNATYLELGIPSIDAIIGMDILMKATARILLDSKQLQLHMNTLPQPNYYNGPISQ